MTTYKIPELFKPVCDSDLTQELRATFHSFFNNGLDGDSDCDGCFRSPDRLKQKVSAHPILARAIFCGTNGLRKWSLLEFLCQHADSNYENAIQLVIEANPHALLSSYSFNSPIYVLARNRWNCQVLSWIAERYSWVFQTKLCQCVPPHLGLVRFYVAENSIREKVRAFYQVYPQGLGEKDNVEYSRYPLSASLTERNEPEADFFIWMAEQYSEAVYHKPIRGNTILHDVCSSLAMERDTSGYKHFKCTPNMAKICRYLVSKHPSLIRQKSHCEYLPIHMLAHRCNRPIVQDTVILLLKAYPDCMHDFYSELSNFLFIEQVHPLIVEESNLDEEIAMLLQSSQTLAEASNHTTHTSEPKHSVEHSLRIDSLSKVFCSWTQFHIDDLSARKEIIGKEIADACGFCEGDDIVDVDSSGYDSSDIDIFDVYSSNYLSSEIEYTSSESEEEDNDSSILSHHDERFAFLM